MLIFKDFYFIRHGETDWNREHRGMGQKDIPLNKHGIEQAHEAAAYLQRENIQTICYSPLIRAKHTAEIIGSYLKCKLAPISDLKECSWGVYEGQTKGPWLEKWISGAELEDAESYNDFIKRSIKGINLALKCDGPVLIVAHGGTYWAIRQHANLNFKENISNAAPLLLRAPNKENSSWTIFEFK